MNHNVQKQMNIFYYSKFSGMCTNLLKLMDNYKVLNKFLLKCVDDMPELPRGLERVPTLIVVGIDKPLVAKEAMIWFDNMRPIFAQQCADIQNKQIMYNIMKNNQLAMKGPKGYAEEEYHGISDSFAYFDVDMPQPKTFCEYGNEKDAIYTPPIDDKIKSDEQKRYIQKLEQDRRKQEGELVSIMKKEQIEAIMNNEREKLLKERLGIQTIVNKN